MLNKTDSSHFPNQLDKTSTVAASAIRNWTNTHHLAKFNISDSNTEEDGEDLAGRRQCKLLFCRLH